MQPSDDQIETMCAEFDIKREDITCETCTDRDSCVYAYDPYNTDGDCLAEK